MGTKNNPDNRGAVTELRVYNGKKVEPIMYIDGNRRYIAGIYEGTTDLVIPEGASRPIPYANI